MSAFTDALRDRQLEHERRQRQEYEEYVARVERQDGAIETTYRRVTRPTPASPPRGPASRAPLP